MRVHLLLSAERAPDNAAMVGIILWPLSDWLYWNIDHAHDGATYHFGPLLAITRTAPDVSSQ